MIRIALTILAAAACTACATAPRSTGEAPKADSSPQASAAGTRVVKSRDGRFEGEIAGTAVANSKFSKLVIGMDMAETQDLLGRVPDRMHLYESGKRWIPFYFGNDARRMQVLYKGEGCLIFTGGNVWGASGGDLIQIAHDPSGACYQP